MDALMRNAVTARVAVGQGTEEKVCRQGVRSVGEPTELLGESAATGVAA